jgi:hypothetical protein
MHTDYTLAIMERSTTQLAQEMCKFATETCPAFVTKELRHEAEAQRRREAQGGPVKTAGAPAESAEPSDLQAACAWRLS